jgi:hypothetical protein
MTLGTAMRRYVTLLIVGLSCVTPSCVFAGAVIPDTPSDYSALDQVLSNLASRMSGGPVRVVCYAADDFPWPPDKAGVTHGDGSQIDLSEEVCSYLRQYAAAADPKPTYCETTIAVDYVIKERVRYRKTIRKRIHGKVVRRKVWRTKIVKHPAEREVLGPSKPCWTIANQPAFTGSPDYRGYTFAIETMAHEITHAADDHAGRLATETHAECNGMTVMDEVTVGLGGTAEDGDALAAFYADFLRSTKPPEYTQPCLQGADTY